ncbi:MAG: TOBE domain-containing protein [Azoarcus sp.]|jgi:molybdate transport system regulatory protein|nr:TOBE domain-containing protein [Azoarcus sp.]
MQRKSEPSRKSPRHLTGRLEVETEQGAFLGDARIRLLESIDTQGSISKAAKYVPLSYKAAWDTLDAMNNLAEKPLVVRATGGRNGGGTQLTDYGRQIVSLYRALEAEYQAMLERLVASMNEGLAATPAEFRRLLRHMSMKTSARNQFVGTIVGLRSEEVDFEVVLKLDDMYELTALITRDSAENLDLKMGMEIQALVKAPSVQILSKEELKTAPPPHNCLQGEVKRIHRGKVNSEYILVLPGGKTVCAVIPNERANHLALVEGSTACATFEASSVILCVIG